MGRVFSKLRIADCGLRINGGGRYVAAVLILWLLIMVMLVARAEGQDTHMPKFIEPVLNKVIAVLEARTPNLLAAAVLPAFTEFKKGGLPLNFPEASVEPMVTDKVRDEHLTPQLHRIRIRLGISDADPGEVTRLAMIYAKAVDDALSASWSEGDWDQQAVLGATGNVLDLFVAQHDYGPLRQLEGAMAKFPEILLLVEVEET